MSQPENPSFHLRLPPEIKARLLEVKGESSLNSEIVERLDRSLEPDPAMQLAEVFRPILSDLDAADRVKMIKLITDAVEILQKRQPKRPRRATSGKSRQR
ncbi:Arc family DNA-binding protein [Mesorhizobium xinjiangense]|uniref:Arc family DNA-binding protein n=1 Tax=Mesorhizobium xinjiangense TaxID=2678685 RepID=UPI0012EE6BB8|nr:Arc family DNA-binding protein [Mesorhizobium xinjiangense]